tara:strand:+ start:2763 stop:2969 length:207 start_codon:yes stop_codon:yes gene_type:complete
MPVFPKNSEQYIEHVKNHVCPTCEEQFAVIHTLPIKDGFQTVKLRCMSCLSFHIATFEVEEPQLTLGS